MKARELGLNPKKFGKLANNNQEAWKTPLPEFTEEIYFKRFGKEPPKNAKSVEQIVKDKKRKQAEKKERKREEQANQSVSPDRITAASS